MKEKRFTLKKTTYDIFKSRERNYLIENKTLNEKDITKVHDKILKALEHKLGAVLR